MWTVNIQTVDSEFVDVTATDDSGFSYSSRIKEADYQSFVDDAKSALSAYQTLHQNDATIKSDLEKLLNA